MLEIQIVKYQPIIFRIENDTYQFIKPHSLYKNFGTLIKSTIKGSTLGWNIEGYFISYNQLKSTLCQK